MRRATERSPAVRLWITLGTFLAQPGSYPHKTPPPESCCRRAPHFAHAAPHTLQRCKCAPALKKKRLSTKTGVLYYYCYLYIKPLKNNQNPKPGHLSTADGRAFGRLDRLSAEPSPAKLGKAAARPVRPAQFLAQALWALHRKLLAWRDAIHAAQVDAPSQSTRRRIYPHTQGFTPPHQLSLHPCSTGKDAPFLLYGYQLMSIQGTSQWRYPPF